jgi:hypothetical protein
MFLKGLLTSIGAVVVEVFFLLLFLLWNAVEKLITQRERAVALVFPHDHGGR